MTILRTILLLFLLSFTTYASGRSFTVRGRVLNETTRQPVSYVAVTVDGQPQRGGVTNEQGEFEIVGVEPGITRLVGQSIGYDAGYSYEVLIDANTPAVELSMKPSTEAIDTIYVRPSLFRILDESPVSIKRIGMQQIEKSPGANRDVSRIVQSFPGVAFSPAGYRNDLIVRGGSPSENTFYVDGIEIPNINHFSTEGASGGPVSILNADLIREIEFYSGAFPVHLSGAMSSIMDVELLDGDLHRQSFKATLGASEVSLSGSGHFSERTTYLFSIRQSYLQLMFKALGLPFLPNFIDGQIKLKHKLSANDEITFLALAGLDDMTLNESGTTETSEYILSYLPEFTQNTVTTGVRYRHFEGANSYSLVASHSYLNNYSVKYQDNDDSDPSKLNYDTRSVDQKTTLRSENRNPLGDLFTLRYGAELNYIQYSSEYYKRLSDDTSNEYSSDLGYMDWGFHVGAGYKSANDRFTASLGTRFDGNGFSTETTQMWEQFSPRLSLSYALKRGFTVSGSTGIYYSMPPLTALSYEVNGEKVNGDLDYIRVKHLTAGLEWRPRREIFASVEGFYKNYDDLPISTTYDTPLADQGDDYGTVGNDTYVQTGEGRAYGVEIMGQWQEAGKLSFVASLTLYRSEYATDKYSSYRPSSWDNRVIFNASGTYFMRKGWSVGAKVSAIGGSPFTPYDVESSALIENWDVNGQPLYDYSLYNTGRLESYAQLDLRVDKVFYLKRWMLGLYLDLQNSLISQYTQPSIPVSTGVVDPSDPTRYEMKYLNNVSGTLLPTFGVTAKF